MYVLLLGRCTGHQRFIWLAALLNGVSPDQKGPIIGSFPAPRTKEQWVEEFIEKLPGLTPNVSYKSIKRAKGITQLADIIATVYTKGFAGEGHFYITVSTRGTTAEAIKMVERTQKANPVPAEVLPMLLAPIISENSQTYLKQWKLGYLDLTGNAYINFDQYLVDKENGADKVAPQKRFLVSLSAPKTSRVILALLASPGTSSTVSGLCEACSVSPAEASNVLAALEKRKLIARGKRGEVVPPVESQAILRELSKEWAQSD